MASLCVFAAKPKAQHVILVASTDGVPYKPAERPNMPNVKKLMSDGCYTPRQAYGASVVERSQLGLYCSMVSPTEIHGYTTWGSKISEIPSRVGGEKQLFSPLFYSTRNPACIQKPKYRSDYE